MKSSVIDDIKKQIEFLYGETARQKRSIEELDKLILYLMKLIAKKEEDIEEL